MILTITGHCPYKQNSLADFSEQVRIFVIIILVANYWALIMAMGTLLRVLSELFSIFTITLKDRLEDLCFIDEEIKD